MRVKLKFFIKLKHKLHVFEFKISKTILQKSFSFCMKQINIRRIHAVPKLGYKKTLIN